MWRKGRCKEEEEGGGGITRRATGERKAHTRRERFSTMQRRLTREAIADHSHHRLQIK